MRTVKKILLLIRRPAASLVSVPGGTGAAGGSTPTYYILGF